MKPEEGVNTFHAKDKKAWRDWLKKNHGSTKNIWLILYHKNSKTPCVSTEEAIKEALCFSWIDIKPNKRDSESSYLFFLYES